MTILGYTGGVWPASTWRAMVQLVGLPFRAFALATFAPYPRVLVLEIGLGGPIESLSPNVRLMPVTVGVVTAIGPAHLQQYGNIQGVIQAKSPVIRGVKRGRPRRPRARQCRCSRHGPGSQGARREGAGSRKRALRERCTSRRTVFGVPSDVIERGIASFAARMADRESRSWCTDADHDTFNANPLSMEYGLDTLAATSRPEERRGVAISVQCWSSALFGTLPRGNGSLRKGSRRAVVGVGTLARDYKPDRWFESSAACVRSLSELVRPGDRVLVKGSHSIVSNRSQGAAAVGSAGAGVGPPTGRALGERDHRAVH